jgi:hypothetical protein
MRCEAMREAYLTYFSSDTGVPTKIDDLPEVLATDGVERLNADQVEVYGRIDGPIDHLVSDAIRVGGEAESFPDALVYATTTLGLESLDIFDLASGVGFAAVPIYGSLLNGCTNAGMAIATGTGLLAAGLARVVRLVSADCARPGARLCQYGMGVIGDAVAACDLVGDAPATGYRLLEMEVVSHNERTTPGLDGWASYTAGLTRAVRVATGEAYARAGIGPEDARVIVTNNMTRSAQRFLAACTGVRDEARIFRDPVVDSHCGADVVIGLGKLLQMPFVEPGDLVVALASSFRSSAVFILERVGRPAT